MIEKLFQSYHLTLSEVKKEQFQQLLDIFLEKNTKLNLSAIRDAEGVIEKHFIDSIIVTELFGIYGKVLDLGTGGGFPGIPLKIWQPSLSVTLLDSIKKKIGATEEFITSLKLTNIDTVWGRAEEVACQESFFEKYDFVVTGAVGYLPKILEYGNKFLKSGGIFICYKLPNKDELNEGKKISKKYHLHFLQECLYTLGNQERALWIFEKY